MRTRLLTMLIATAGWWLPNAPIVRADEARELTIRGETRPIWPADELRRRGYDLPDIPKDENAAWTYLEAINSYVDMPDELREPFSAATRGDWPEGEPGQALGKWLRLKDNVRAMNLARRASLMEQCQLPYFGDPQGSVISVLLPNLTHMRMLAKIITADGTRLESRGDYAAAVDNYVTVCRMGNHSAQGFTIIEGLVGIACWALADNNIRDLVLRQDLEPATLEDLLTRLATLADRQPTVERGVQMERVTSSELIDEFVTRPSHLLANIHGMQGMGFTSPGMTYASEGWGALEARLGRLMLPDRTMKQHVEGFYDELVRRSALPAYEADWNGEWEGEIVDRIPKWNLLARWMLPSLSRANVLSERARTAFKMTRICTSLRLYALRHDGQAPDNLDQVVESAGGSDVLIDPLSGRQFTYQPDGDSWMLYSFGENGTDDGGRAGDNKWELDFVVRYPVPEEQE